MDDSLVMIPGLNCNRALFDHQINALSARHNVYVPDLAAFGSIADMASYVLDTGPRTFSLAGLSMGGYVALELVRAAPGRIKSLILLNTTARADTPERARGRHAEMELASSGRFNEVLDLYWAHLVHPSRLPDRQLRHSYDTMALSVGPDAFCRHSRAIIQRRDHQELMKSIQKPTLIAVGTHDGVTPAALSQEMASAIGGAQLELVPRCGHLSTLECPAALSRRIGEFLAGQAHK